MNTLFALSRYKDFQFLKQIQLCLFLWGCPLFSLSEAAYLLSVYDGSFHRGSWGVFLPAPLLPVRKVGKTSPFLCIFKPMEAKGQPVVRLRLTPNCTVGSSWENKRCLFWKKSLYQETSTEKCSLISRDEASPKPHPAAGISGSGSDIPPDHWVVIGFKNNSSEPNTPCLHGPLFQRADSLKCFSSLCPPNLWRDKAS